MTEYYTKEEINELLEGKSNIDHRHASYEQQIQEINDLLDDLEAEVLG